MQSAAAGNMDASMVRIIFYIVLIRVARGAVYQNPCAESRDAFGELTVDCSSKWLTDVPVDAFPNETTRLILSRSKIQVIPADAFRQLNNLRTLDLSGNHIRTFHDASFRGLTNLQQLNLNDNEITFFPAAVFNEMYSLETLTISGFNQKYEILPTLPVNVVVHLRTLSLSLRNGAFVCTLKSRLCRRLIFTEARLSSRIIRCWTVFAVPMYLPCRSVMAN